MGFVVMLVSEKRGWGYESFMDMDLGELEYWWNHYTRINEIRKEEAEKAARAK